MSQVRRFAAILAADVAGDPAPGASEPYGGALGNGISATPPGTTNGSFGSKPEITWFQPLGRVSARPSRSPWG
jgi:hypothetical protein